MEVSFVSTGTVPMVPSVIVRSHVYRSLLGLWGRFGLLCAEIRSRVGVIISYHSLAVGLGVGGCFSGMEAMWDF